MLRPGSFRIPDKYVLFTGQKGGHKNSAINITGCLPLLKEPDMYVVCTYLKYTNEELALFD